MKRRLDMEKIAGGLALSGGARFRRKEGHFGAMQVLADVEATFRVPAGPPRSSLGHRNAPVTITRCGQPVLAILLWEFYESIVETNLADPEMVKVLRESLEDLERGRIVKHAEARSASPHERGSRVRDSPPLSRASSVSSGSSGPTRIPSALAAGRPQAQTASALHTYASEPSSSPACGRD